jgi:hypothetical protein
MKTIICSETLRLPTGAQLHAFSRTERRDRSGEVPCRYSRPTLRPGQGGLWLLPMCLKSGGVPAVLSGGMIYMGRLFEKLGP